MHKLRLENHEHVRNASLLFICSPLFGRGLSYRSEKTRLHSWDGMRAPFLSPYC
jgi:hypothetical protein